VIGGGFGLDWMGVGRGVVGIEEGGECGGVCGIREGVFEGGREGVGEVVGGGEGEGREMRGVDVVAISLLSQ
jgi:hypothetical protein